jgi:hypothetical protein
MAQTVRIRSSGSEVTLVQAKATHVPDLSTPCSAEFISDERLKLYRDLEVPRFLREGREG